MPTVLLVEDEPAIADAAALPWAPSIAWWNVRHCAEAGGPGPPLDRAYLVELGPTCAPAAAWFALATGDRWACDRWAGWRRQLREEALSDPRGWSLAAWWAYRASAP